VVVKRDNNANYQSVIRVMDAARQAASAKVAFAVEQARSSARRVYGGRPAHLLAARFAARHWYRLSPVSVRCFR